MKKRKLLLSVFFILEILFCLVSLKTNAEAPVLNPFSVEIVLQDLDFETVSPQSLLLRFKIPSGYYLYADKIAVRLLPNSDFELVQTLFPEPEKKWDVFLKKELLVFSQNVDASAIIKRRNLFESFSETRSLKSSQVLPRRLPFLEIEISYQGCSETLCYSPKKETWVVPFESHGAAFQKMPDPKVFSPEDPGLWQLIKNGDFEQIQKRTKGLWLLFIFLAGIASAYTPCVLPAMPLVLAAIGVQEKRSLRKNFILSLLLVLGLALTFTTLGLFSSLLGASLHFLFQSRIFIVLLIALFLFFALSLWGFFSFELPMRLRKPLAALGGSGYRGAFLAGLALGSIVLPCVGPLLAGILLWVSRESDFIGGASTLFVYALGLGLPFLVAATFYASFGTRFRGGAYTKKVKKGLAILMLVPVFYYIWVLIPAKNPWNRSLSEGFAEAKQRSKPILIDFYAKWCLDCLELEAKTFSDPRVQKELENFVLVRIDCTQNDAFCAEAAERYEVAFWPTVLFVSPEGQWIKEASVFGFHQPDRFLESLNKAREKIFESKIQP